MDLLTIGNYIIILVHSLLTIEYSSRNQPAYFESESILKANLGSNTFNRPITPNIIYPLQYNRIEGLSFVNI